MQDVIEDIEALFVEFKKTPSTRIEKIPQSGGDRKYFRIYAQSDTYIATYNLHVKENRTFIAFTRHFKTKGLPVPEILIVNAEETIYLQQDLGTASLLNKLEQYGHNERSYLLFQKSLTSLASLQIKGDAGLDYNLCLTAKEFGKQAIMSDLLYFKYY